MDVRGGSQGTGALRRTAKPGGLAAEFYILMAARYALMGLSEAFQCFSSQYRVLPSRYDCAARLMTTTALAPVSTSKWGFSRVRMQLRKLSMCASIMSRWSIGIWMSLRPDFFS